MVSSYSSRSLNPHHHNKLVEMETHGNFVQLLGPDVSAYILTLLDDPADIVRASAVSRTWRQFVIANGFCKNLCLKLYPEVSTATHAIEVDNVIETKKFGSNSSMELETLENKHKIYAMLARGLAPNLSNECIAVAIGASSTDNYPEETIQNTLIPSDRVEQRPSYWSSDGESDAGLPETLTYRLISKLCFISEINIQPFQAYFQYGFPIYSAQAVRFKMGHFKSPVDIASDVHEFAAGRISANEYINWTYVSPEYPMLQENCLQKFKLPHPVLCIGGLLQIELLGRVQKQEMDGLFYICVSHVQVAGRPLSPPFDAGVSYQSGKCLLEYSNEAETSSSGPVEVEHGESSRLHLFTARLVRNALNSLLGNAAAAVDGNETESDDELYS